MTCQMVKYDTYVFADDTKIYTCNIISKKEDTEQLQNYLYKLTGVIHDY